MSVELLDLQGVSGPFKKDAKYADLQTIPETWVGELVHGDLYAFPRPRTTHSLALTRLIQALAHDADDDSPEGWIILHDVEIWFGKNLLVPDVCGWRRRRLPELPDVATMKLAPDWVCEGMSPSTARLDKGPKREIYARAGVPHLWYVDPALHTVDVFALAGTAYSFVRTAGEHDDAKLAPFPHPIDLSRLWKR